MGRIFEVRKSSMFARYDRMAKQFSRVGKEIAIAVKKGGPEPDTNPMLRRVMQNAKGFNMPKDRIEAAIKNAMGKDTSNYDEVLYEGYAPHGIALLVVTATDNTTRTVANVRSHFNKGGGTPGNSGSVVFLFKHLGVFKLKPEGLNIEDMELELIDFGNMQKALEEKGITPISSELEWIPLNTIAVTEEQSEEVFKLIERLEQDDDVQHVFHNMA